MNLLTEEFINEVFREFLLEAMNSEIVRGKIGAAIKDKRMLEIDYSNESPGKRIIEPFAMGVSKHGKWCVRAWIHQESLSHSYPYGKNTDRLTWKPGWRMFNLEDIRSAKYIADPNPKLKYRRFDGNRPHYNANDSDMQRVYFAVKQGGPSFSQTH